MIVQTLNSDSKRFVCNFYPLRNGKLNERFCTEKSPQGDDLNGIPKGLSEAVIKDPSGF